MLASPPFPQGGPSTFDPPLEAHEVIHAATSFLPASGHDAGAAMAHALFARAVRQGKEEIMGRALDSLCWRLLFLDKAFCQVLAKSETPQAHLSRLERRALANILCRVEEEVGGAAGEEEKEGLGRARVPGRQLFSDVVAQLFESHTPLLLFDMQYPYLNLLRPWLRLTQAQQGAFFFRRVHPASKEGLAQMRSDNKRRAKLQAYSRRVSAGRKRAWQGPLMGKTTPKERAIKLQEEAEAEAGSYNDILLQEGCSPEEEAELWGGMEKCSVAAFNLPLYLKYINQPSSFFNSPPLDNTLNSPTFTGGPDSRSNEQADTADLLAEKAPPLEKGSGTLWRRMEEHLASFAASPAAQSTLDRTYGLQNPVARSYREAYGAASPCDSSIQRDSWAVLHQQEREGNGEANTEGRGATAAADPVVLGIMDKHSMYDHQFVPSLWSQQGPCLEGGADGAMGEAEEGVVALTSSITDTLLKVKLI